MALKIVFDNAILRGSQQEQFLQRVATVYVDGADYRVYAPAKATGDALDWIDHFSVRQPADEGFGSGEASVTDGREHSIIQHVAKELEQRRQRADIWKSGADKDARYYAAQICVRGHVLSSDGKTDFKGWERCPRCGSACIDSCQNCTAPIRGQDVWLRSDYVLPLYCYKCGQPYPWMMDRLQTAKDLLDHDDKLSLEEREKLWGLLQYVMSDPKSDLAPAKKKLFEIGIARALPATREFFLDLLAKLGAEMMKP
ncbi:MAG: DUF2321 domain-containing protein [Candidatus Sulfotelmatobacter sp.]